jgi:hypothetical protein
MWTMGGKCPYKLASNQFTAIFTYNVFRIEGQFLKRIFQISVLIFNTPHLSNFGPFLHKIQVRGQISSLSPNSAGATDPDTDMSKQTLQLLNESESNKGFLSLTILFFLMNRSAETSVAQGYITFRKIALVYGSGCHFWAPLYLQCVQVPEVLECVGWNLTYLVEPQVPATDRGKRVHLLGISSQLHANGMKTSLRVQTDRYLN